MVHFARKVLLSSYAFVKDFLPFLPFKKNKFLASVSKVTTVLITVFVLAAISLSVLPFLIFRTCLHGLLKLVYRDSYCGFLNGMDTLYEINETKTVFNVVIILSKNNGDSNIIEDLKRAIIDVHNAAYKFTCSIKRFCGYNFYVKNQVKPEQILEVVTGNSNKYMTKESLTEYMEKNCIHIKENQMWKIIAFTQPIRWNEDHDQANEQYAAILMIRHSLGDGPSIVAVLKKLLVERQQKEKQDIIHTVPKEREEMNLDNVYMYRNPLLTKLDGVALRLKNNNNTHLATFIEPEPEYISAIKRIKQKLNVTFTDVVSTAICSSVTDYIAQRKVKMNNITLSSIVRVRDEDIEQIINGGYDYNKIFNKASIIAQSLPYGPNDRTMKDKILRTHKSGERLKGSVDFFIVHGFLRSICPFLPIFIARLLIIWTFTRITICISNLIGFRKSTFSGHSLDDVFFCVPKFVRLGFMFCIFSYDGRLGMAVTSSKGYVHNRGELQTILNNVFKYIDEAERDIVYSENKDRLVFINEYIGTHL